MPRIEYYKNKMEAWGPDDHGTIKNLGLYKGYKAEYERLLGETMPKSKVSKPKEPVSYKDLKTKDQLNDFAAVHFPDLNIKAYWSKNKMLDVIMKADLKK